MKGVCLAKYKKEKIGTAKIYMVEVGVVLDKSNKEHDSYAVGQYGCVETALYDEIIQFYTELGQAIKDVDICVREGVVNTYGVITEQYVDDDITENEDRLYDLDPIGMSYKKEAVVYTRLKKGENIYTELELK